jgi:uncharacterized protein (DUF1501 family)
MNRRDFLKTAGLTAAAFGLSESLLGRVARAAEQHDRYVIVGYFEGGWDALLGLDPRDPAEFDESNMRETGIQPAYDRLPPGFSRTPIEAGPFALGPAAGDELAALSADFSIVRGINMATLTHEVGRRYFITGRAPSGLQARGNSVATLCCGQLGADRPVPHLAHQIENYNVDQPSFAGAMSVAAVDHVQYILQENLGLPTDVPANVKGALGAYWARRQNCDPTSGAAGSRAAALYAENRTRAREVVTSALHRNFQFAGPELLGVRQHYGLLDGQFETPYGRAALAAQALKVGLSRVVSLSLSMQLDTHDQSWATDHPVRLYDGFTALARLIADLKASPAPGETGSLWDKTTLVCFSEFTRTPRINDRNGRDHHLGNCALIAGAGIRGGQVVGSSDSPGMGPVPIDFTTGLAQEGGQTIAPEHVMSTLLAAAGLDASSLRSEALPTLLA